MKSKILLALICLSAFIACQEVQTDEPYIEDKKEETYIDDFVSRELPAAVINKNPKKYTKDAAQNTSLETLTRVDALGELYRMDYCANYGLAEMLAAGGVKSNNELLGYVQKYLLQIPVKSMSMEQNFGCAAFLAKGKDGHYLYCRNFEYMYSSPVNVITRTKGTIGTFSMNMAINTTKTGTPDDGKSDNSYYVAAPLIVMDGMNEHGVAISVLMVYSYGAEQHQSGKSNIITTVMIREVLDKAKTVDEALALFDSHNFFAHGEAWQQNFHFFIADSTGRSVVVEYVNSNRNDQNDKNYKKVVIRSKYVTNNFLYDSFRMPLSDDWREALIARRVYGVKGKADAFKLLLDVSRIYDPDQGRALKVTEQVGPNSFPETLWSVVYDLTDKKAYIITGRENIQGLAPFEISMM